MKTQRKIIAIAISRAFLGGTSYGLLALHAAHAADDNTQAVQSITVTAQSRSQAAQSVPIPLSLVNADQLDKLAASNLAMINGYVPGLVVDGNQPTQPNYFLRGVGTQDFGIGTDSPVGVYVDGVYTGKSGGAMINFNDVQRIEVLKGPQGTLFGRNSAGGAISIISREPTDTRESSGHVRVGNYGSYYVDGVLNIPLNDQWAFRLSAVDNQSRGWLTDASSGEHSKDDGSWGTRASLKWSDTNQNKMILSWEHEELNQKARPAISFIAPVAVGTTPTYPADSNTFVDPRQGILRNDVIGGSKEARVFNGVSLRFEHPLGWADFSSTTAYRHFTSINREDEDGTNQISTYLDTVNHENNTTWQQEFKFSGKNERIDWVAGLSLFHESAHQTSQVDTYTDTWNTWLGNQTQMPIYSLLSGAAQQFGIPVNLFGQSWQENMFNKGNYDAYAAYGDVIWHLTDKLNLTTGLRLTHDSKEFSWYAPNRIAPGLDAQLAVLNQAAFFPGLLQAGAVTPDQLAMIQGALTQNLALNNAGASQAPLVQKRSWSDVSPRFVLDYKWSDNTMTYGSVTKGYQAGGFNSVLVAGGVEPETVWNYELGIKANLPEQRMSVNASLFHYKFSNLQSLQLVANGSPNGGGIPAYQVTSSDQVATGFDFDMQWRPTRDLRLYGSAEYIDQHYNNYVANDGTSLNGQAVGTPFLTATAGLDYSWREVAGGRIDLTLQHAYTGAVRCNADSASQLTCLTTPRFSIGEARQRTDLRVGWSETSHRWGVALYVNNLFDKRYVFNASNITSALGTPFGSITPPRIVGVELSAKM